MSKTEIGARGIEFWQKFVLVSRFYIPVIWVSYGRSVTKSSLAPSYMDGKIEAMLWPG